MTAPPARIVVQRVFFDAIKDGRKRVEYRRHRSPFIAKNYWPGREIKIDWRYDMRDQPSLWCRCLHFEVLYFHELPKRTREALAAIYRGLGTDAEIALIHLELMSTK